MTDDLNDADTSAAAIARRSAIDAVSARLEEICRLAPGEDVVEPEPVASEPGRDTQAERRTP
jgi:hypothetical protein